jgi:hypothetical protein
MRLKAFAIIEETLHTLRLKKAGFYNFLKQDLFIYLNNYFVLFFFVETFKIQVLKIEAEVGHW